MVMLVSDCSSPLRNRNIAQLQQHLPIDIMSAHPRCEIANTPIIKECRTKEHQQQCFEQLGATYKFYLALEASDCTDFVSESVWRNSFRSNMIPVVWGLLSNYAELLPSHSYINCADYPSAQECAGHIEYLAKDEMGYNNYHEWKQDQIAVLHRRAPFDALCEYALRHPDSEKPAIGLLGLRGADQCLGED